MEKQRKKVQSAIECASFPSTEQVIKVFWFLYFQKQIYFRSNCQRKRKVRRKKPIRKLHFEKGQYSRIYMQTLVSGSVKPRDLFQNQFRFNDFFVDSRRFMNVQVRKILFPKRSKPPINDLVPKVSWNKDQKSHHGYIIIPFDTHKWQISL